MLSDKVKQKLKNKSFRYLFIFSVIACLYAGVSTFALVHYQGEYDKLNTALNLRQIQDSEGQRSKLIAKIGYLEDTLERTRRFTLKLESAVGVESGRLSKGVGPISQQEDLGEFLVRVNRMPKVGSKTMNTDWRKGKFDDQFFGKLSLKLDELSDFASYLEERVNNVYEVSQEKLSFWSSTPNRWPVRGWITSDFGMRLNPFGGYKLHEGIDIAAPFGTNIFSPSDGVVVKAKYSGGYGNMIVIDHGYGLVTRFGHTSEMLVNEGDRVYRGQKIALVGSTGASTGPHLHYEVLVDGVPTNPKNYIFEE